jgi:hypothetical protein
MADNPFGTPVAGLALEMAVRQQDLINRVPAMAENQRRLLNLRLQRYGGDIADYQNQMDVGYDAAVTALRKAAEARRDYLVGMPELMAKAMKEGEKSGVTYKAPEALPAFDMEAERQRRKDIAEARDAIVAPTVVPAAQQTPFVPQPRQTGRLRPSRGNY